MVLLSISCGKKGAPTLRASEKPVAVKEIRVVHRGDELIISWSYPASERAKIKGFYIEKTEVKSKESEVKSHEFKNIAFVENNVERFIDKDFRVNQIYLYKIRAYSLRDILSDETPVMTVKPLPLPEKPTDLKYTLTDDSVRLQWHWPDKSNKYNVYKSYEKESYPFQPFNAAPVTDMFFYDRIESDRKVYYTVRALLDTDIKDEGLPAETLEVNPAFFAPSKPAGLSYAVSEKNVYLIWAGNPESWITGYRVYRQKQGETGFKPIGDTVTPAFKDDVYLAAPAVYYVTAIGISKESIPSDIAEVAPVIEK